ncbi:hypothetical protein BGX24_006160 [Mortierella sp. AD032]|nr:hypothetical protein BGX24_006160 [Mortierella sp. AD032]
MAYINPQPPPLRYSTNHHSSSHLINFSAPKMKFTLIAATCLLATLAAAQKVTILNKTPSDIWVKIASQGAGQNDGFVRIGAGSSLAWTRAEATVAHIDFNDQRDLRVIRVDPDQTYQIGADLPKRGSAFSRQLYIQ